MKKIHFPLLVIVFSLLILATGCDELHEMAEASLDDNHLDYKGPSPYPEPLGTPAENICYLWVEDIFEFFGMYLDDNSASLESPYSSSGNISYKNIIPNLPPAKDDKSHTQYFSLSEGLEYVGKGGKEKDGNVTTITRLNYMEVPVLLNYNHEIAGGKSTVHAGFGPYAAMAFSGKFKSSPGQDISVKFGKSGDFNRMDYGLGFNAGVLFAKKWDVSLGYDLGLRNLIGQPGAGNDGDKGNTRSLSLNVGFRIK